MAQKITDEPEAEGPLAVIAELDQMLDALRSRLIAKNPQSKELIESIFKRHSREKFET